MIKVACIHPQSITLLEAANQLTYTPSSKDQWYVFDPVHLYELQLSTSALSALPNNTSGMNRMISHILANLTATYTNTHVQWVKKLSQCLAVLERLTWHKSNKLYNNLKIIYVILGHLSFHISLNPRDLK
jgi:hypothetical protein